ncbi:flocculation protein FLO5 [Kluyveromyces marxianus]|nr:flocculation protein FLO5 [Kluyveromyces marxianus]
MKINIPWTGTYTTTYSTGAFTSTGSNGIQTVQTAFYVKTPEMGSSSFGYSNTSSTTSHGTDSNGNKNLQSETSNPLVRVSVTSGNVIGHSTAETNLPISQETSSNRPTTSKNDDGPVPERRSTANINTPLGTTMNAVGETSGVVSGILDTETRGKQTKTMSISVGQPVTVSSATSKATSPQPSLNPSIPTFTPSISGASQSATFETRLEDKANKILISPLVIILLAFL